MTDLIDENVVNVFTDGSLGFGHKPIDGSTATTTT